MAFDDPRAVSYVNENLRPLCEKLRAIQAELQTSLAKYVVEIAPITAAADPADILADGREDEGVSRLSAGDVALVMGLAQALSDLVEDTANQNAVGAMHKACVRPLRITTVGGVG